MKRLAIIAGSVLAAVTTASLLLGAASQYTYRHRVATGVTAGAASAGATWFINQGAWDGSVADMDQCRLSRTDNPSYPSGFVAECYGRKTVPADSLPEGAKVIGVIN